MKKIAGLIFASFLILCSLAAASFAQTKSRPRSINNREQRQQKRIVNGAKSGALTAREIYRLEREQYQIRRLENRYRSSGGRLTWREKYRLQRELNQSSRNIYKQKHDRQNYPRRKSL